MDILAKVIGACGLVLITCGVLIKNERRQDILFIAGSAGLLAYSIYLRDPIFIPLQIVFIVVTAWELFHLSKK